MAVNEPDEMVVRMRNVMATTGLVLRCVHPSFQSLVLRLYLSSRLDFARNKAWKGNNHRAETL